MKIIWLLLCLSSSLHGAVHRRDVSELLKHGSHHHSSEGYGNGTSVADRVDGRDLHASYARTPSFKGFSTTAPSRTYLPVNHEVIDKPQTSYSLNEVRHDEKSHSVNPQYHIKNTEGQTTGHNSFIPHHQTLPSNTFLLLTPIHSHDLHQNALNKNSFQTHSYPSPSYAQTPNHYDANLNANVRTNYAPYPEVPDLHQNPTHPFQPQINDGYYRRISDDNHQQVPSTGYSPAHNQVANHRQFYESGVNKSANNYDFRYGVTVKEIGADYGHEEERRGDLAKGFYRVLLPDGRVQQVDYEADALGYRPTITYRGRDLDQHGDYRSPVSAQNIGTIVTDLLNTDLKRTRDHKSLESQLPSFNRQLDESHFAHEHYVPTQFDNYQIKSNDHSPKTLDHSTNTHLHQSVTPKYYSDSSYDDHFSDHSPKSLDHSTKKNLHQSVTPKSLDHSIKKNLYQSVTPNYNIDSSYSDHLSDHSPKSLDHSTEKNLHQSFTSNYDNIDSSHDHFTPYANDQYSSHQFHYDSTENPIEYSSAQYGRNLPVHSDHTSNQFSHSAHNEQTGARSNENPHDHISSGQYQEEHHGSTHQPSAYTNNHHSHNAYDYRDQSHEHAIDSQRTLNYGKSLTGNEELTRVSINSNNGYQVRPNDPGFLLPHTYGILYSPSYAKSRSQESLASKTRASHY